MASEATRFSSFKVHKVEEKALKLGFDGLTLSRRAQIVGTLRVFLLHEEGRFYENNME